MFTTTRPPGAKQRRFRKTLRGAVATVAALASVATLLPSGTAGADPLFDDPGGGGVAPPATSGSMASFRAVGPSRVVDTREGDSLAARDVRIVDVTGVAGVPAEGVTAIVANVTVTEPTAAGYLTLFPSGNDVPTASNLNFVPGQTVPNAVTVPVGADGNIAVFNGSDGTVEFIIDITGWYGADDVGSDAELDSGTFRAVGPSRVVDTREGDSLAARDVRIVDVTGVAGVPDEGVTAIVANVTVTEPTAAGYLTLFPSGNDVPTASNLNFVPGQTVPNAVTVPVGADGNIAVFNGSDGTVEFIIDITGWYGSTVAHQGLFEPLGPSRVVDTREADSLAARDVRIVDVTGVAGVPDEGVTAIVANVTVTEPTAAGYLTLFPSGNDVPTASNLNFVPGQTVPNAVTVPVGADGNIAVFNGSDGTVEFIIDITGWFGASDVDDLSSRGALTEMFTENLDVDAVVASAQPTEIAPDEAGHHDELPASVWAVERGDDETGSQPDPSARLARLVESAYDRYTIGRAGYLSTLDPAVGRLYKYDSTFSRIVGTCTGTVVGRNLVLTAAHCVDKPNYRFAPQQVGSRLPYGAYTATHYWVPPQYDGRNSGADFALLLFNRPDANGRYIGDRTGWFAIHADAPAGSKYSIGYPGEGWFHGRCSGTVCEPYHCHSQLGGYRKEASDSSVSYGGWWVQGIGCYMTGGASGGPMFQNIGGKWYVVGVNSFIDSDHTYRQGCNRPSGVCFWYADNMWAPYLNQSVIRAWHTHRIA